MPFSTPEYIYVVLEADMVMSVSDAGIQVFDYITNDMFET